MHHKTHMKLKFKRILVERPTGDSYVHHVFGDEKLQILQIYITSEMGEVGYEDHLEAIRKIRNDEIVDWSDGGNSCGSWVKKDGVIIEDDYALQSENNTLSLSLDQFEKAIIGWKTFVEDESLMEYEVEI
jgi:hypothetical protein